MKETPETIALYTGLSLASVRRHVLKVIAEKGSRKTYTKDMVLNGLSVAVYERIAERAKDETVQSFATARARALQTDETSEMQSVKPVSEIRETNNMKPMQPEVKPITQPMRNGSVQSDPVKPNETAWYADIGNTVLSHPNVRFLFVIAMVIGQAYMFAMLEQKVMKGTGFEIATGFAIAIGILFEAVGFMIARSIDVKRMLGEYPIRNIWLGGFFAFQCITNLCLIEPWSATGFAMIAGRFIIAISIPVGLAAYSFLYFKHE